MVAKRNSFRRNPLSFFSGWPHFGFSQNVSDKYPVVTNVGIFTRLKKNNNGACRLIKFV